MLDSPSSTQTGPPPVDPIDDMTDPAVSAILSHLDTPVILSRTQAGKGIFRRWTRWNRPAS